MAVNKTLAWLKALLFMASLVPFVNMLWGLAQDSLGANPVEAVTHETGLWALRFLWLTLAITPLRRLTGQTALVRFRRMLGLFSFFYASLHLLVYVWLDQYFDWAEMLHDIAKRPFITVGFAAFVLMLPLALSSNKAAMRRLKKNWQRLHRMVYVISVLAVLHFLWLVKADVREPVIYGLILVILLAFRLPAGKGVLARFSA